MYLRWQYRIVYSRLRSLLNKCFHSSYFSLRTVSAKISILTSSSPKQVHLACSQGGLAWNPKTICVNKERTWLLASMPHGWPSMPPVLIILLESTVTSPSWLVKVSRSRWWDMLATKFSNGIKKGRKLKIPKCMDTIWLSLHNEIKKSKVNTTVGSAGYLDYCCVPYWLRIRDGTCKNVGIIEQPVS